MMRALAWIAEQLAGPWLKSLMLPALVLGLVTAAHQYTRARAEAKAAHENALVARGRQQCIDAVLLASAEAKAREAQRGAETARLEKEAAVEVARTVGEVNVQLESRIKQMEDAAAVGDGRCLSDGMRDRIWGAGRGPGRSGNSSGAGEGGGGGRGQPAR